MIFQAETAVVKSNAVNNTVIRTKANPETVEAGKTLDANGLRPGSLGGYVDYGTGSSSLGDSVTFAVSVETAGSYTLHFRYANGGAANRPLSLVLNGATVQDLPFASTGANANGWSNWTVQSVTVNLAAGANSISLAIGAGSLTGPNLDALAITAPGVAPSFIAPEIISSATVSVAENSTTVFTIVASDSDNPAGLTYALASGGADNALFRIHPTTGALSFITPPDFESPTDQGANNIYNVSVQVSDGTSVATQMIAVTVTDSTEGNRAPVLQAGADVADVSTAVGTAATVNIAAALGASDPDGDALSYIVRLKDGAGLPAGINLTKGVLTVGNGVAAGKYTLQALASDGSLTSAPVEFDVTVTAPQSFTPITVQAEAAAISLATSQGTVTVARTTTNPDPSLTGGLRPDYSGNGYVDFGDDPGDRLTFTITVAQAGSYDLNIRYASQNIAGAARTLVLGVNGTDAVTGFPDTASGGKAGFDVWGFLTKTVALSAGTNTITLAIPPGVTNGPNIDRIEITQAGTGPIGSDNSADVDGNLFLSGPDGTLSGASADSINFNVSGVDPDIILVQVSFDGGMTKKTVLPDADGDFTIDGSGLSSGTYTTTVFVTDAAGNKAQVDKQITIKRAGDPDVFQTTLQAEAFTLIDADRDTIARDPGHKENAANSGNSGTGLTYDANGLWGGYTGSGYLDMGDDVGDMARTTVTVPDSGTYHLTLRYALGPNGARPMVLEINGVQQTISFTSTGAWNSWGELKVSVQLSAGSNDISIANAITNGPNIDSLTIVGEEIVDTRAEVYYTPIAKINFEPVAGAGGLPGGYTTPAGYFADSGAAFGDRGNGLSYGWVTEASVADGTANGTTPAALNTGLVTYSNAVGNASDLQKTSALMEGAGGSYAWEMAVANGSYQVKIAVGDTSGASGSIYALNIEGKSVMPHWSPNATGGSSAVITAVVNVTDGRLTIDSIGGVNTELQYVQIDAIPDLTPNDGRAADLDYSYFAAPVADSLQDGQVSIALGADGSLPSGIDPTSTLVVGVVLRGVDYRGPNILHTENVKLVETLTGIEVSIAVQISGGADTLNVRPLQPLKEFTSYTLMIEDVLDLGSLSDANAPLRQMQDLTTTFVTGDMPEEVQSLVSFETTLLLDGFADGAGGFTSVEFGPDGKLYVATITGEIYRWAVNADGSVDKASKESLILDYLDAANGERRGIIGFTFDPDHPNTIWITDNAPIPRESKSFETPEFSGRVSKITLGANMAFTGVTAETYISGLPRSGGDHLTNSLEFRTNPAAGQPGEPAHLLYLTQGSNTAAGGTDPAWGNRPERLLNASILEIDPSRSAPSGGFDVRTEPLTAASDPTTTFPSSAFNADGTYPGMYNPFAADAVLKIYATGVRNAYDLVWHSNGNLYVATNGTAAGGKTPQDPDVALDTTIDNSPKEYDWLFTVQEGGYYGHPNPRQGYYIMNGGNPTTGKDPNEVVAGSDGNPTTDGYAVGVLPEANYDVNNIYSLGYNRSANGSIEYTNSIFGSQFKGALLIAQFSVGDNIRVLQIGADGKITSDDVLRRADGSVIDNFIDPLDIIENPVTGDLYLITMNRSTGASQLVLLTPTPNGAGADTTADEGNDLALVVIDTGTRSAVVFEVTGLDSDITALRVAFNGQPATTVTLDANHRFTVDLSLLPQGNITAAMTVTDDALNTAQANTQFILSSAPAEFLHYLTIQAEDRTPNDGTSVIVPITGGAQIVIRDGLNPQGTATANGMVNGLYTGAYGPDGNTNDNDGVRGGYTDFGATNADYMTFNFSATSSSSAILRFRYANGGSGDRPLQLEVNGVVMSTLSFPATGAFNEWEVVEVVVPLTAGANAVTLRSIMNTGPNIDQMEILTPSFTPLPATINGSGRIELEATNGSALMESDTVSKFYFTVAADGVYKLDTAMNAGGLNGGPLSWSLNGLAIETTSFPGVGTAGEQSIYLDLKAGQQYRLQLTSATAGANSLDYLDLTKAPTNANADVAIQSLDPAYFDDRLHFNYLENPVQSGFARDYKSTGQVQITNTGTAALNVLDYRLDGPFSLANPTALDNLTIAAGQTLTLTVNFDRSKYTPPTSNVDATSTVFHGNLTLYTNDEDSPTAVVKLAGFWQATYENGQEPNVNEIWEVFGFGNRIENLTTIDAGAYSAFNTHDIYMKNDATEILSPYWQIADGYDTARVTQIAAYHGAAQAYFSLHAPGANKYNDVDLWIHAGSDNQRILPNIVGSTTAFATSTFTRTTIPDAWAGDDVFGLVMDGVSSDPRLNNIGGEVIAGTQQGHFLKMFQAYDEDGNIIPTVYLGIMDYPGINYDFNDNLFIIEGVKPVGVGPTTALNDTYPDPDGTPVSDLGSFALLT